MESQGRMESEGTDRGTDRPSRKERRRLRQLRREREGRRTHRRAALRRWLVRGGIASGCLVAVGGGYWLWAQGGPHRLPKVGDHWHAAYEVVICGRQQPPLAYSPGNIHTHGDGLIHIHPTTPEEAGRNANLGRFFANSGITVAAGRIRYPDGRAYRDGDPCPDGTRGRLRLLVNGEANASMDRYVPQDGDKLRIEFGPE